MDVLQALPPTERSPAEPEAPARAPLRQRDAHEDGGARSSSATGRPSRPAPDQENDETSPGAFASALAKAEIAVLPPGPLAVPLVAAVPAGPAGDAANGTASGTALVIAPAEVALVAGPAGLPVPPLVGVDPGQAVTDRDLAILPELVTADGTGRIAQTPQLALALQGGEAVAPPAAPAAPAAPAPAAPAATASTTPTTTGAKPVAPLTTGEVDDDAILSAAAVPSAAAAKPATGPTPLTQDPAQRRGKTPEPQVEAVLAAPPIEPARAAAADAIVPVNAATTALGPTERPQAAAMPAPAEPAAANAIDRALAHQVAHRIEITARDGERQMTIRLTPPELGTVRVQIIEHHGNLQVRLSAEDEGVRMSLERALPNLRAELRGSELGIADVQVADQHLASSGEEREDRSFRDQDEGAPPRGRRAEREADSAHPLRTRTGGTVRDDHVDARA